jgi:hypothetical protein
VIYAVGKSFTPRGHCAGASGGTPGNPPDAAISLTRLNTGSGIAVVDKRLVPRWLPPVLPPLLISAGVPRRETAQTKKPRVGEAFKLRFVAPERFRPVIRSDSRYVNSSRAFLAVLNFELNVLAFSQGFEAVALDSGEVYKHIFAAVSRGNEAKTFRFVEPLNLTFNLCHLQNSLDCFLCLAGNLDKTDTLLLEALI